MLHPAGGNALELDTLLALPILPHFGCALRLIDTDLRVFVLLPCAYHVRLLYVVEGMLSWFDFWSLLVSAKWQPKHQNISSILILYISTSNLSFSCFTPITY
jgi:hypothetical protein